MNPQFNNPKFNMTSDQKFKWLVIKLLLAILCGLRLDDSAAAGDIVPTAKFFCNELEKGREE